MIWLIPSRRGEKILTIHIGTIDLGVVGRRDFRPDVRLQFWGVGRAFTV